MKDKEEMIQELRKEVLALIDEYNEVRDTGLLLTQILKVCERYAKVLNRDRPELREKARDIVYESYVYTSDRSDKWHDNRIEELTDQILAMLDICDK